MRNSPGMVKKSFEVCGITTTDPGKVRSDEFYRKITEKVKSTIDDELSEDEDPFEL